MRLLKHASLFLCGVVLVLTGTIAAQGQKKGNDGNSSPAVPPAAPSTPYSNVKRDSLLNGLQVVSLERMTEPVVKCYLVIRAGAMFDLTGKTGIAKLTQETLLAANPSLKEEFESLQAKIEWGVNWDTTWFQVEAPASSLEAALEILGRVLVVENIRPEAFKLAYQRELDKLKSGPLPPPDRATESFLKALYGDHPYGHDIDGDPATISGIRQGDVYDFMRRFYIANNVSVVSVGNITHERMIKIFKVYYGGWMKGQLVPSTFRQPRQVVQLQFVKVEAPESPQIEIRGGVMGLKHTDADFLVTEVLAQVLSSRLKKALPNAPSGIEVKSLPRILPGPFFFSASVPVEQAPAFSRQVTETFASLSTTAITPEELAAAKAALASEYSARPVDFFLREIEVYSLPRNHPTTILSRIEKITAADGERVAKKLLDSNALTVLVLGKVNDGFKSNL
ncbi:MAG TPA: pitrilysin family protein [Blastocatellia bacterium]|nr:pitrilysin family protein [Blastocatellia bacterium]